MKNYIPMESTEKEPYVVPTIVVVEVKAEGVICTSNPEGEGHGYDGWD